MSSNTCSISATQRTIMSQTTQPQNKTSKKVATTTTTGSSAATLSSLVSKKKSAVPVLECKRSFKDDGTDGNDDEEKRSSEEEDTSDDCEDGGDGEILNESSKKNKISSKFDQVEYAKLLAEIFPSKYSKKKAITIESLAKKTNGVKEQKVEKQKCENITATVGTSNSSVSRKMKNTETAKLQSAEAPSTASNSNVVGNYNIVINIKEPFEDLLEEDEYTSDMDDSVYDDESASSNDNSSDETYNDDDETSETDDDEDEDDTSSDQDDDDSDTDDADADAEEVKCEKYGEKDDTKTKYGFEKCKLTVRGKSIDDKKTSGGISSGKNKKPELLTSDKGNDHDYDSDGGWNTEDETTIQAIKAHMEDLLATDKNNKIAR